MLMMVAPVGTLALILDESSRTVSGRWAASMTFLRTAPLLASCEYVVTRLEAKRLAMAALALSADSAATARLALDWYCGLDASENPAPAMMASAKTATMVFQRRRATRSKSLKSTELLSWSLA